MPHAMRSGHEVNLFAADQEAAAPFTLPLATRILLGHLAPLVPVLVVPKTMGALHCAGECVPSRMRSPQAQRPMCGAV